MDSTENLLSVGQFALVMTIIFSAGAAIGTPVWWRRHRPLPKEIQYSLAMSIGAALPGFVFSADVCVRLLVQDNWAVYDLPSTLIACLWLFAGPLLLAGSWGVRSKVPCPLSLWILQASHALVFAMSVFTSFVAMLFI